MNVIYQSHSQTFRFTGGNAIQNWRVFDAESLRWAEFSAATGEWVKCDKDCSCRPSEAQMSDWQAAAAKLAALWAGRLSDLNATLYIRYGDLPEGGRSTNYVPGKKENGVSVYPAKYDVQTGAIIFDGAIASPGTLAYLMTDRVPHLVSGQYAGVGSDGEPCALPARLGAELRYDAALNGFFVVA